MCLAGDATLRPWLARHVERRRPGRNRGRAPSGATRAGGKPWYQINLARLRAAERTGAWPSPAESSAVVAGETARVANLAGAGSRRVLRLPGCCLPETSGCSRFSLGFPRAGPWAGFSSRRPSWPRGSVPRCARALGRWASRQRIGLAVLFVVLYLVYRFVGVLAAGTAVDFFEDIVFGRFVNPLVTSGVDRAAAAVGSTFGIGARRDQLVRDMLVGPYGLVTVALTYALAIILPIVTAFFLAFSVLEDSGYLPRLAVMVNRAFQAMGLNGKAVLPMVLGLGCDTMATLTARIMETRKERLLVTLLLALGIPCSAQLGVILGLFGALPAWAPVVWGGVVLGVLFVVGFLAARLLPGETSDLILELPPIRRPQLGNVVMKTVGTAGVVSQGGRADLRARHVRVVRARRGRAPATARARLRARRRRRSQPPVQGGRGVLDRLLPARLRFGRDLRPVSAGPALAGPGRRCDDHHHPLRALRGQLLHHRQGARTVDRVAISGFIFPFAFLVGGVVNVVLRSVGLGVRRDAGRDHLPDVRRTL